MKDTILEFPRPPEAGFNRGKRRALLVSLAMIGAVLWPIQQNWRDKPKDDFPLSYYPMFSNKRDPVETFYYLIGRDAQGMRHHVPYAWIGDGGGNQVRRQLRKIINDGRGSDLAKSVAKRIAKKERAPWSEVISVAVCQGKYDVNAFYHGHKEPVSEKVKGFATVERRAL